MKPSDNARRPLPFGSWPSPVSASLVAGKSLRLGQPQLNEGAAYWLETRPEEKGRTVLVRWTPGSGREDILPGSYSVQSKVHEYGGGAYAVNGERAWFVNKSDQRVHQIRAGVVRPLTEDGSTRCFADLVPEMSRNRLLAVCEDHDSALDEPRNSIVAIDCDDGTVTELCAGADFYSSPRPAPDARRIAWLEWNHPDMPWDATRLFVAELDAAGMPRNAQCIAGGAGESVLQPLWRDADELVFASDRNNWWNLHSWRQGEVRELYPEKAEFALPHWVFGMRTYGLRDHNTLVCAWTADGKWRLGELDLRTSALRELDLPYTQIEHVHAADGGVILQAASASLPASIALIAENDLPQTLRSAAQVTLDEAFLPPPEAISFQTGENGTDTAYGLYYPPAHDRFRGEAGTAPPLLVKAHGGPTAATSSALDMKIRFWTSRGFAVLDVNYRGSTGYGREYREKLHGHWGIRDVEDCINGALEMARRGLADRERLLISGSSAGGFTVLCALTFHDVFAAGASYYGVADLAAAMRDTGKFESRYGDKLIGPLPETESTWRARSPLFHAERLERPVIFLQGMDDNVVPPDQSQRMHDAALANGVMTEYLRFPTEGHGFRQAATIEAALNAEYAFYCRALDLPFARDSEEMTAGGEPR